MSQQAVGFLIRDRRNKGWFRVSNDIWLMDIGRYAKLVYCYLCRCAEDATTCNPSFPDMRRKTGCSHGTIVNALQELENVGLIRRTPEAGTSTRYEIFDPIVERTQSQVDRPEPSHGLTAPQSQVDRTPQSQVDRKEDLVLNKTEVKKTQQSQQQQPAPRNGAAKSEAQAKAVQVDGLLAGVVAVDAGLEAPPVPRPRPTGSTHAVAAPGAPAATVAPTPIFPAAAAPAAPKVVKLEYPEAFGIYWMSIPEKAQACGKKAAFEKWKKALKDGATVDEIMVGLERWKVSRQWADGFINHATTWLHQERWKVQPEPAGANRGVPPAGRESIEKKWQDQPEGMVAL